jgi:hypothetical protein
VKPPLRTKTLGTKVSEEEFAQLEAAASERGLTLSEWCRETLLAQRGQTERSLILAEMNLQSTTQVSLAPEGGRDIYWHLSFGPAECRTGWAPR